MRVFHFYIILAGSFMLGCNSNSGKSKAVPDESVTEDQLQQPDESQYSERDPEISEKSLLIEERAAGEFKLGSPIPVSHENYTITQVEQTRNTDGGPTEEILYVVKEGDKELMKILPDMDPNTGETTGDIGELRITSEKYRTAEGIGVGSTLEEFLGQYPDYKIWYTYVSGRYVVETEEVEAQFFLEETDFIGEKEINSAITPLKKEDFKEGARIKRVRLF